MPSSVYSPTEGSDPRLTTPGLLRNNSAKSPFQQIPNPFESAFSPPSSQLAGVVAGAITENNVPAPSRITPLRVKARKPVPPVVTTTFPIRQPLTVAPEDIDGLPFPSTPTVVREGTQIAELSQHFALLHASPAVEGFSSPIFPTRDVQPSLPTLEKAASTAIFFETLYHALLKPPQTLQAAHPDNYACGRERRRLALEEEMKKRGLVENDREALRKKWAEEETANLRERRRKIGLDSFIKLKVIGHGKSPGESIIHIKKPHHSPCNGRRIWSRLPGKVKRYRGALRHKRSQFILYVSRYPKRFQTDKGACGLAWTATKERVSSIPSRDVSKGRDLSTNHLQHVEKRTGRARTGRKGFTRCRCECIRYDFPMDR